MSCFLPRTVVCITLVLTFVTTSQAQIRVTPKKAKGGEKQGKLWESVPELYQKKLPVPKWDVPTNLKQWKNKDRAAVRKTLLECLGEMPPRPQPAQAKILSTEQKEGYRIERIRIFNGEFSYLPTLVLIPDGINKRVPAIIVMHGHGSGKESVLTRNGTESVGELLVKRGYVVAAIDSQFNGERVGHGVGGRRNDHKRQQEHALFAMNLWLGRTLWGMQLRDEQCLLDYLQTRKEVDADQIGATGMSMGCTRSWWLAAIDDRVRAVVGVACFTRYTDLIAHGNFYRHSIYYFVPKVYKHFDTEAIYSLIAPRAMLQLSGDQDGGAPTSGIVTLEKKLDQVYRLYGKPENFRSVIYKDTAHEYLPEMKEEMLRWFSIHLPAESPKK